jgi:hypothetical protein
VDRAGAKALTRYPFGFEHEGTSVLAPEGHAPPDGVQASTSVPPPQSPDAGMQEQRPSLFTQQTPPPLSSQKVVGVRPGS